ncbi:MAG: sugar isomerase domain-containing protein [Thermaerobacter sp.]|nr:sugar isomerase domain-containing protein [Thermaerobacter sp.]
MLGLAYTRAVRQLIEELEHREMAHLQALGERMAEGVQSGHVIHLYDNGHMLNHEMFNRAGGLALLARLDVGQPTVANSAVRPKAAGLKANPSAVAGDDLDMALARYVVDRSAAMAGDDLIIGSVSGRSPLVVELALGARERGIRTVALTALKYARTLPARHVSGKLLYQVTDDVIDIGTEAGDAALTVEGLPEKLAPTSGIMAAVAMWALEAAIAEALLKRGITPTVFRSVNYPDGPERLDAAKRRYETLGY